MIILCGFDTVIGSFVHALKWISAALTYSILYAMVHTAFSMVQFIVKHHSNMMPMLWFPLRQLTVIRLCENWVDQSMDRCSKCIFIVCDWEIHLIQVWVYICIYIYIYVWKKVTFTFSNQHTSLLFISGKILGCTEVIIHFYNPGSSGGSFLELMVEE